VETCIEYRTVLGNCTTNCALGNCTANCTGLGSALCKNLGILTSKKLSRIANSDFNGTNSSTFSTGNTPKNLIVDQLIAEKGKEIVFPIILRMGI
jgi:hypothetical protein